MKPGLLLTHLWLGLSAAAQGGVRLHSAEPAAVEPGRPVFTVMLEGKPVHHQTCGPKPIQSLKEAPG